MLIIRPEYARSIPDKLHEDIVDTVLRINGAMVTLYRDDEPRRKKLREEHPTVLAAGKCMDGRVNLALAAGYPLGVITPYRSLGGGFTLDQPFYAAQLKALVERARAEGRQVAYLSAYHYSSTQPALGCKGFSFDTGKARAHIERLAGQISSIWAPHCQAMAVGLETDREELVFHGKHDIRSSQFFDRAGNADLDYIATELRRAFPAMSRQMAFDLAALLHGNVLRTRELTERPKPPIDLDHRERIMAVGRGFDYLTYVLPNGVIVVNDYMGMIEAIGKQAGILLENLQRNPQASGLLMVCIPFDDPDSPDYRLAKIASEELYGRVLGLLRGTHPELLDLQQVKHLVVVKHTRTKQIEVLHRS